MGDVLGDDGVDEEFAFFGGGGHGGLVVGGGFGGVLVVFGVLKLFRALGLSRGIGAGAKPWDVGLAQNRVSLRRASTELYQ